MSDEVTTKPRTVLRVGIGVLAFQFLLSAVMNLGYKIPLGFASASFLLPSTSIAEFEIAIAVVSIVAIITSNLYVYGGALLFAVVGIAEGLLSADVQRLARYIHESMLPFVVASWILLVIVGKESYRAKTDRSTFARRKEIVTVMQFFVGGLVTLGGAAYTRGGVYPVGTTLGAVHLIVGLAGLYAGYVFLKAKPWSNQFLVWINAITIAYSTFSESLAEIYAYLPQGITDALIGTIIAITVSCIIIYTLHSSGRPQVECTQNSEFHLKQETNYL